MSFVYQRTIRFSDTDAAGVVYFATVLSICHEAYEASLAASSVNLKKFFTDQTIAIPIVHAEIDFLQPMFCGESYEIHVDPAQLGEHKFAIGYEIFAADPQDVKQDVSQGSGQEIEQEIEQGVKQEVKQKVGQAKTIHLCINPMTRKRQILPSFLLQWLRDWV